MKSKRRMSFLGGERIVGFFLQPKAQVFWPFTCLVAYHHYITEQVKATNSPPYTFPLLHYPPKVSLSFPSKLHKESCGHVPQPTFLPEIYLCIYTHMNVSNNCLTHLDCFSLRIFMESVASTSSPRDRLRLQLPRFKPSQAVADRIVRALHHHLHLLHRSDSNFFVLGATGNVYIVSLSSTPSCTCPDRITPCKHILFIYIRALGVSIDDVCLRRRTLRPCQLNRLLAAPIMLESLAEIGIRRIFHQRFFQVKERSSVTVVDIEDGTTCPVCLDDMKKNDRVVACTTCRNLVHEDCFLRWKRSKGRRTVSCVVCRARWKNTTDQQKYLNLSAYVNEADAIENNLYDS